MFVAVCLLVIIILKNKGKTWCFAKQLNLGVLTFVCSQVVQHEQMKFHGQLNAVRMKIRCMK